MRLTSFFLLLLFTLQASAKPETNKFSVAYEWNYLNFTWPSPQSQANYAPGSDIIAGIKIYNNTIYLALPRVKNEARVTLAAIPLDSKSKNQLLSPFPNWELNSGAACTALQNVLSMEIDPDGVMWVLDAVRTKNTTTACPPQIVLLDINAGGRLISRFVVPDALCPLSKGCFLNDIVVDGDFAYISDTTASDPGILIYDRRGQAAWKARNNRTMSGATDAVNFTAQGVENTNPSNVNGIALGCKHAENKRRFYYMPQTSLHIYGISNEVLRNRKLIESGANLDKYIVDYGTKQGQSGGMICDSRNDIYYGVLPKDAVGRWATQEERLSDAMLVEVNHEIITWPDSFAIYQDNLYLITNSMSKFTKYGVTPNEINFRIIKLHTGTKSYLYC